MIETLLLLGAIVALSLCVYFIAQQITKETPFEEVIAEQKGKAKSLFKGEKSHKKPSLKVFKKVKSKKDEAHKGKKHQPVKQRPDPPKKHADFEPPSTQHEDKNSLQQQHTIIYSESNEQDLAQHAAWLADPQSQFVKQSKSQHKMKNIEAPVTPSEEPLLEISQNPKQIAKKEKSVPTKQQTKIQAQDVSNGTGDQPKVKSAPQKKPKQPTQKQEQIESGDQLPIPSKLPSKQEIQESPEEPQQKKQSLLKKQQMHDGQKKNTSPKPQKMNNNANNPPKQNVEQPQKKEKPQASKKTSGKPMQPQQEVTEEKMSQAILALQKSGMQDKAEQHKKLQEVTKKKVPQPQPVEVSDKVAASAIEQQKPLQSGHPKKSMNKKKDGIQDSSIKQNNNKATSNPKQDSKSSSDASPIISAKKNAVNQSPVSVKSKRIEVNEVSSNVEEQMKLVSIQMQTDSSERRKKDKRDDKKENKEKIMAPISEDDLGRLMPMIRKAKLSSAEIQEVVETLLNKQQQTNTSSEWVEKGRSDPVMSLKRQLEEAEARLKEQNDTHSGLSAKITNLRADLNSERAKNMALKKQLDNASAHFDQKLFAANAAHNEQLKIKLNELHISLDQSFQEKLIQHQQAAKREIEKHQQQFASAQTEVENQLQQYRHAQANIDKELQSSHSATSELEQQKQQLQAALADSQTQLQNAVQNREELVQTCQQYQQHLASIKDKLTQQENTFNSQLGELKSKLSIAESSRSQSLTQCSQVMAEREQLKQKVNKLEDIADLFSQSQSKLQNANREKLDMEGRLQKAESELSCVREISKSQVEQIERLKEEKESLASQSVRPAAEGQENGDIHAEPEEPLVNEHLNKYEEKLSSLTKEITRLKEELSHQRRKNDEEKERWEEETNRVAIAAKKHFPDLVAGESFDQAAFITQVKTALDKKPEVIEKITEKIVEDPKLKKLVSDLKKENSSLLQKVESLEKEKAVLELRKDRHPSPVPQTATTIPINEEVKQKFTQLQEENKGLHERVAHYQEVLANTESLLKSLQISVENEEAVWQGKLTHSDNCVRELKKENTRLSLELSELQSSLDKVKQAEEMEHQLVTLREKLSKEEEEKRTLEKKLQKEEQSKVVLQEQLNNAQEQINLTSVPQVVSSSNGPANGLEEQEDQRSLSSSLIGSESLVSGSSVSEGSEALQPTSKPKKKKKKSFFSKLIG